MLFRSPGDWRKFWRKFRRMQFRFIRRKSQVPAICSKALSTDSKLLGFMVVLCRLYLLALHPAYAARAAAQSTVTLQLPARRGGFFDAQGQLLTGLGWAAGVQGIHKKRWNLSEEKFHLSGVSY